MEEIGTDTSSRNFWDMVRCLGIILSVGKHLECISKGSYNLILISKS